MMSVSARINKCVRVINYLKQFQPDIDVQNHILTVLARHPYLYVSQLSVTDFTDGGDLLMQRER